MPRDTCALLVKAVENRTPDHIVAAGLETDLIVCTASKVEEGSPEAGAGDGRDGLERGQGSPQDPGGGFHDIEEGGGNRGAGQEGAARDPHC